MNIYTSNEKIMYTTQVGVFMVRVPEPKEISVRVPEISGLQNGEPYPNRNFRGTETFR